MKWAEIKYDRRYALVLLVFAILYGYGGSLTKVEYFSGTVGPHHWIYMIAGVIALLCIDLFIRPTDYIPDKSPWSSWNRRIPLIIGVLLYSYVLPELGYPITMILLLVLTSMLFGAKFKHALLSSAIMTIVSLALFDFLLGISLGRGLWFL